jgi:hypothetical protein
MKQKPHCPLTHTHSLATTAFRCVPESSLLFPALLVQSLSMPGQYMYGFLYFKGTVFEAKPSSWDKTSLHWPLPLKLQCPSLGLAGAEVRFRLEPSVMSVCLSCFQLSPLH